MGSFLLTWSHVCLNQVRIPSTATVRYGSCFAYSQGCIHPYYDERNDSLFSAPLLLSLPFTFSFYDVTLRFIDGPYQCSRNERSI